MRIPPITDEKMRANLAKQILIRTYPDIYAEVVSSGEWKPYTYLRYIAREIAKAIFAGNGRILLSAPPRHCKSYLTTKWIPTWFLDNWPHKKIMVGAHSGEFAVKWGRDVRSEFENNPNVISKLREDSQAAGRWNTPQGGGMLCLGAGGRALGFGADCFPAGTTIETEFGKMNIEAICALKNAPRVLTFVHDKNRLEWGHIVCSREKISSRIVRIKTSSGRSVRCTADHLVYVSESGYRIASSLKPGDRIVVASSNPLMRAMPKKKDALPTVLEMLAGSQPNKGDRFAMRSLQKEILPALSSTCQGDKKWISGRILQLQVFVRPSRHKKQKKMRGMWNSGREKDSKILSEVQGQSAISPNFAKSKMPFLQERVSPAFNAKAALQSRVRQQNTFCENERSGELPSPTIKFSARFSNHFEAADFGAGQAPLHDLREGKQLFHQPERGEDFSAGDASYGQKPHKQCDIESRHAMRPLSQEAPCLDRQWEADAISSVEDSGGDGEPVYDIQVEKNHNFFANEILVHNCAIIDDPIGSWEDAHSPTIKDKVWDWFSADIYSRQEPGSTIIITQQRLADDDLIGRIIDVHGAQRWTVIRLPAIAEIGDIMGRTPGQPLCPDRFDIAALNRIHEDMARSLGEESWNCMYQQKPSGAGMGRVYSRFDPVIHERKGDDLQLSPDLPLQLSFDFNVNPGVHLEIGQYDRHKDLFTDVYEIHGDRQKTAPTMDAFERWVESMGGFKWRTCEIYGDRSGKTESTNTSETDYAIIEEKMRKMGIAYTLNVPEANPPIKDRVNSFQEALVDSRGEVHYLVHERCERIREDLRRLKEGDDGLINKKDQKLSHGCLAEGTMVSTVDGNIPIEKIKVGCMVNTRQGPCLVSRSWLSSPEAKLFRIDCGHGVSIAATDNHPIFCHGRGFKMVSDLVVGDELEPAASPIVKRWVMGIAPLEGLHPVYDLTVESAHEFYANGILVSNSDARGYSVFWQRPIGGLGTLNEIIDLGDRNRRAF